MYITALKSVACIEFVMTFPDKIFVCINHFIYIYLYFFFLESEEKDIYIYIYIFIHDLGSLFVSFR